MYIVVRRNRLLKFASKYDHHVNDLNNIEMITDNIRKAVYYFRQCKIGPIDEYKFTTDIYLIELETFDETISEGILNERILCQKIYNPKDPENILLLDRHNVNANIPQSNENYTFLPDESPSPSAFYYVMNRIRRIDLVKDQSDIYNNDIHDIYELTFISKDKEICEEKLKKLKIFATPFWDFIDHYLMMISPENIGVPISGLQYQNLLKKKTDMI